MSGGNLTKMFKSVALCAPRYFKVAYKINPWMGGTVDSVLAQKQWDNLKQNIEKCGVEVKTIPQVDGLPDMVFCCNSGIVYGKKKSVFVAFSLSGTSRRT